MAWRIPRLPGQKVLAVYGCSDYLEEQEPIFVLAVCFFAWTDRCFGPVVLGSNGVLFSLGLRCNPFASLSLSAIGLAWFKRLSAAEITGLFW